MDTYQRCAPNANFQIWVLAPTPIFQIFKSRHNAYSNLCSK